MAVRTCTASGSSTYVRRNKHGRKNQRSNIYLECERDSVFTLVNREIHMSIQVTDNSEPTVYYSFKVDPYESDKISSYGHAYWNPNN